MSAYHYEKEIVSINASAELVASFASFREKNRKNPGENVFAHVAYKESLRSEIIRLRLSIGKLERNLNNLRICDLADIEERDFLRNRLIHEQVEYQHVLARYRTLV